MGSSNPDQQICRRLLSWGPDEIHACGRAERQGMEASDALADGGRKATTQPSFGYWERLELSEERLSLEKGEPAMSIRKVILVFTALIVCCGAAAAQEQTQGTQKVIKHVPVRSTSPVSGKEMYTAYCAVCHGTDGKGGGPAASALKVPPSDLTLLSKNNGGNIRR